MPFWKPLRSPPVSADVVEFSPEAQIVWEKIKATKDNQFVDWRNKTSHQLNFQGGQLSLRGTSKSSLYVPPDIYQCQPQNVVQDSMPEYSINDLSQRVSQKHGDSRRQQFGINRHVSNNSYNDDGAIQNLTADADLSAPYGSAFRATPDQTYHTNLNFPPDTHWTPMGNPLLSSFDNGSTAMSSKATKTTGHSFSPSPPISISPFNSTRESLVSPISSISPEKNSDNFSDIFRLDWTLSNGVVKSHLKESSPVDSHSMNREYAENYDHIDRMKRTDTTVMIGELPKEPVQVGYTCSRKGYTDLWNCKEPVRLEKQKSGFTVPLKKKRKLERIDNVCKEQHERSSTNISNNGPDNLFAIRSIEGMSFNDIQKFKTNLTEVKEVAMTLIYDDGSSQLSDRVQDNDSKKGKIYSTKEVKSVVLAYPVQAEGNKVLDFVNISMVSEGSYVFNYCKEIYEMLMKDKMRKLCFNAQVLIQEVAKTFDFDVAEVSMSWRNFFDPKIASWLLKSDKAPETFGEITSTLEITRETSSHEATVCRDLALLGSVTQKICERLKKTSLWTLFVEVEMTLTPILASMTMSHIRVNTDEFKASNEILTEKLTILESAAHKAAGHSFLINSHPQLRQVLFEELKLDSRQKIGGKTARTSCNQKSTSEAVLSQLQHLHPLPAIVLEYRQIYKLKSTYFDGMLACTKNGRLRSTWDQTAVVTGRLSSANPNIQAIPKQTTTLCIKRPSQIKGKDGERIEKVVNARSPFISKPGHSLVAVDFQQIEFRIFAHLAGDKSLLMLFNDGDCKDIFIELSSLWLGKASDDITAAEREQTKRIVYSVLYGAGKDRMAEYLKITPSDARTVIQSFLAKFPCINQYTKECIKIAQTKGYQTTIFGRRRYLAHIKHPNPALRAQAERQAMNFCVQGSAADICKAAMIEVLKALLEKNARQTRLLIQIHDELLFEVPDDEIANTVELIKSVMEDTDRLCKGMEKLTVPLRVSLYTGKSWGHMTEYLIH